MVQKIINTSGRKKTYPFLRASHSIKIKLIDLLKCQGQKIDTESFISRKKWRSYIF